MVGWIENFLEKKMDSWMDKKQKKQMDGLDGQKKYNLKKMDGWMDKKIDGRLDG